MAKNDQKWQFCWNFDAGCKITIQNMPQHHFVIKITILFLPVRSLSLKNNDSWTFAFFHPQNRHFWQTRTRNFLRRLNAYFPPRSPKNVKWHFCYTWIIDAKYRAKTSPNISVSKKKYTFEFVYVTNCPRFTNYVKKVRFWTKSHIDKSMIDVFEVIHEELPHSK